MRISNCVKAVIVSFVALSSSVFADDLAQQMEEMIVMGAVKTEAAAKFELADQKAEVKKDEAVAELPVIEE